MKTSIMFLHIEAYLFYAEFTYFQSIIDLQFKVILFLHLNYIFTLFILFDLMKLILVYGDLSTFILIIIILPETHFRAYSTV